MHIGKYLFSVLLLLLVLLALLELLVFVLGLALLLIVLTLVWLLLFMLFDLLILEPLSEFFDLSKVGLSIMFVYIDDDLVFELFFNSAIVELNSFSKESLLNLKSLWIGSNPFTNGTLMRSGRLSIHILKYKCSIPNPRVQLCPQLPLWHPHIL